MKKRFAIIFFVLFGILISISCTSTKKTTHDKNANTAIMESDQIKTENNEKSYVDEKISDDSMYSESISVPLPKIIALMSSKKELISPINEFDTSEGFVFWDCKDYVYGGETLFQIGYFDLSNDESITTGFIIIDEPFLQETFWTPGSPMPGEQISENELPKGKVLSPFGILPSAELAVFTINGLDYSWEWGDLENGEDYVIIMKPNGSVLYYNFSNVPYGESIKPSAMYKAYKR